MRDESTGPDRRGRPLSLQTQLDELVELAEQGVAAAPRGTGPEPLGRPSPAGGPRRRGGEAGSGLHPVEAGRGPVSRRSSTVADDQGVDRRTDEQLWKRYQKARRAFNRRRARTSPTWTGNGSPRGPGESWPRRPGTPRRLRGIGRRQRPLPRPDGRVEGRRARAPRGPTTRCGPRFRGARTGSSPATQQALRRPGRRVRRRRRGQEAAAGGGRRSTSRIGRRPRRPCATSRSAGRRRQGAPREIRTLEGAAARGSRSGSPRRRRTVAPQRPGNTGRASSSSGPGRTVRGAGREAESSGGPEAQASDRPAHAGHPVAQ
ncbi:hypothetical protein HBB16_03280 [Pseudonocardia sp. MCCB 268]|nr:hypothetical protein [Pseudonocardia cytotoxica]